jgi:hypothetical protein
VTNETDLPPGKQAGVRGCLTLAAIFLVFTLAGALATLAVYSLIVEQWELIRVPREFGFEMILYAPLSGLACGFVAAFWATRGGPSARRAPVLLSLGLTVALGLLVVFFGLGAVL